MPQPPSGDSVMSTQVCSASSGLPAKRATISVNLHDPELLLTIENADRRENLDPDVVAVPVDVRDRGSGEVVDESGGVLGEEREGWDALPAHDGRCELAGEPVPVLKRSRGRVDVDHRHELSPSGRMLCVIVESTASL